jgi:hypothetical protein
LTDRACAPRPDHLGPSHLASGRPLFTPDSYFAVRPSSIALIREAFKGLSASAPTSLAPAHREVADEEPRAFIERPSSFDTVCGTDGVATSPAFGHRDPAGPAGTAKGDA